MKININKVIAAIQADSYLLEEDEARLLQEAAVLKEKIDKAQKAKKMFPYTGASDMAQERLREAYSELEYFCITLYMNFDILV